MPRVEGSGLRGWEAGRRDSADIISILIIIMSIIIVIIIIITIIIAIIISSGFTLIITVTGGRAGPRHGFFKGGQTAGQLLAPKNVPSLTVCW